MTWTPLGSNGAITPTLVDGVPEWMRSGIKEWLKRCLFVHSLGRPPQKYLARVRAFDQITQQEYPLAEIFDSRGFDALVQELVDDPDDENLYIVFLDFLVYELSTEYGGETQLAELDAIFARSGSKWSVGTRDDHRGLEERVPVGVRDAAEGVIATPGHAGQLLSEAWQAAFGVSPDFESAYAKAVKAVEAAAIPVVSPKNGTATLGTVIADIKNQRDWKLDMTREHPDAPTKDVLLGMMQVLWTGQNDRHAGQVGYTKSSRAEAEVAVMLAVPLVQLFTSGAIQRRP